MNDASITNNHGSDCSIDQLIRNSENNNNYLGCHSNQCDATRKFTNKKFHQLRWVIMALASSGFGLMYIYCDCMAVAIVAMVGYPQNESADNLQKNKIDGDYYIEQSQLIMNLKEQLKWNNLIQSLVINIYFIGYAIPQVPLAVAASRFGICKIVFSSYSVAIICMFLLPVVASTFEWPFVLVIRFIKGLAGAAMYSVPIGMIDYWLPAGESTKAITLMTMSGNIGVCLNPLISGYLSAFHWSLVFYVFGIVGLVWLILWSIIVSDTPEQNWLMSENELQLIIGQRAYDYNSSHRSMRQARSPCPATDNTTKWPPWKRMRSERNTYILTIMFIVYFGSYLSFINLLPSYFKNISHLSIEMNGMVTFLVQLTSIFASFWTVALLTHLERVRRWSSAQSRLTVTAIATLGSALMWTLPCMRLDTYLTILGFAANRALHPAIEICLIATVVERWTNEGMSGIMVSFYNSLGNFFSLIISILSGYLLDYEGNDSVETWSNLFMFYAVVSVISWLLMTQLAPSDSSPDDEAENSG